MKITRWTTDRVHLALGLLIGAGGAASEPEGPSGSRVDDAFFVVEPEIEVVVRAAQAVRVSVGVGYRITRGVELLDPGDSNLSGFAGVVSDSSEGSWHAEQEVVDMHPNLEILGRLDPHDMAKSGELFTEDAVLHYFNPNLPELQGDHVGREGRVTNPKHGAARASHEK